MSELIHVTIAAQRARDGATSALPGAPIQSDVDAISVTVRAARIRLGASQALHRLADVIGPRPARELVAPDPCA